MDDGAFEASQVLLRSTTPDVLRTSWLRTIRSDRPVVCLEEADADREYQLLLESQMVIAESLSLMDQHVDQHAILSSMGDAPMASSAGAVVALPVDLAATATAPLDDVATVIAGDASDTATSDVSNASTRSEDFGDFDATDSSPESPTVLPPDDGSSGASGDDIPPDGVTTPTVPVPTPTPNVVHTCDTPGCRRLPGSDPYGLLRVTTCCGLCQFPMEAVTQLPATPSTWRLLLPLPPFLQVVVTVVATRVALQH